MPLFLRNHIKWEIVIEFIKIIETSPMIYDYILFYYVMCLLFYIVGICFKSFGGNLKLFSIILDIALMMKNEAQS